MLESASVSYGKATPYFPVIDLLKRYCHLENRDVPRTVRARVTGHVLTLDEALQDTMPALLALLDVLAVGALGYAYTLSGRLAEAQPLLTQALELTAARPVSPYPLWAAHLGEAYLLAGRLEEANQLAERALARARDCK